jgi:hypothetical protein
MKLTQYQRLLSYLEVHEYINPLEAWSELGIYRLSDVILQLRRDGFDIETERIHVYNRFDEKCKVARYVLNKN